MLHCNGLIQFEEGDFAESKKVLTKALGAFEEMSRRPLVPAMVRLAKASLSMACAKCGEVEQARRLLSEVKPYLLAIEEEEYLRRCEQSIAEAR